MAKQIEVLVFGREECPGSKESRETAKNRLSYQEKIKCTYFDVDTVDGRAEAAYHDVNELPATLIIEKERIAKRWDGITPPEEEFQQEINKYAQS